MTTLGWISIPSASLFAAVGQVAPSMTLRSSYSHTPLAIPPCSLMNSLHSLASGVWGHCWAVGVEPAVEAGKGWR